MKYETGDALNEAQNIIAETPIDELYNLVSSSLTVE